MYTTMLGVVMWVLRMERSSSSPQLLVFLSIKWLISAICYSKLKLNILDNTGPFQTTVLLFVSKKPMDKCQLIKAVMLVGWLKGFPDLKDCFPVVIHSEPSIPVHSLPHYYLKLNTFHGDITIMFYGVRWQQEWLQHKQAVNILVVTALTE